MTKLKKTFALAAGAALIAVTSLIGTAQPAQAAIATKCVQGYRMKTCYYIDGIGPSGKKARAFAYRDSVVNDLSYAISGNCQASTSKTFSWGASLKVTGEFKAWMFSKVSVEIGGSIQNSTTTGYVTSASFKVPAHSIVACDRGAEIDTWHGRKVVTYDPSQETGGKKVKVTSKFTAHAPQRSAWWISKPKFKK